MTDPSFRAILFQKGLLTDYLSEQMLSSKDTRKQKNEQFLSAVISRALSVGNIDPLLSLVKIIEKFDDRVLQPLAKDIFIELSANTLNASITSLSLEDEG